jgi:hypothetical protein
VGKVLDPAIQSVLHHRQNPSDSALLHGYFVLLVYTPRDDRSTLRDLSQSQSQSQNHVTTDGQSVSMSWRQVRSGTCDQILFSGPPLWSSGQSSWLQIRRPGFDSRHYQKKKVVSLERGPLSLVSTTEKLLDRKVAAPV